MDTTVTKAKIISELATLNAAQQDKVLHFLRTLMEKEKQESRIRNVKRIIKIKAKRQIRQAIREIKSLKKAS